MLRRGLTVPIVVLGTACAVTVDFNEVPIAGRIAAGIGVCFCAAAYEMITAPTPHLPRSTFKKIHHFAKIAK